ncbi:MAG: leucyl aminopeptidase [Planctomycetes bacterium]|nr:leucyl aminopeptidase [Planctomycetota bacterium]
MKIRSAASSKDLSRSELVVGFVPEKGKPTLAGVLVDAVAHAETTGDIARGARKWCLFHPPVRVKGPKRLAFVGLGKPDELDTENLRRAVAVAQANAEAAGVASFDLVIGDADHRGIDAFDAGVVVAEGLVLGAYRYQPPKKEEPKARKAHDVAVHYVGRQRASFEDGLALGRTAAVATNWARDLENMAPNHADPARLARAAKGLAGGSLKVKVMERAQLERLGMGALLGVARGSSKPPKLIVLDWHPRGARKCVCVVGKGLTFDSGGISIKPAAKMDEMRYDMCGGGAVLGLFHAIAHGALDDAARKTRVIGVIAAVENMPDADAQRPGDVVRAFDGTTIEVLNTDAEGRLVLCDAIAWAIKTYEPQKLVDLATLTGAVIVALGHECAAVLGNDQALVQELIDAGKAADEPLWQLPLWAEHKKQLESKFADLANINGSHHGGGTIAGAAFLWHFVGKTPWAHLDIAGTAWGGRSKEYATMGATGTAVRTLLHWVRGQK